MSQDYQFVQRVGHSRVGMIEESCARLMRIQLLLRPAIALLFFASAPAQDSQDSTVLHVNVNLVQVDAVVTDSKGKLVTGLTADDFQIFQDGKPQKITHFSYVSTTSAIPAPPLA